MGMSLDTFERSVNQPVRRSMHPILRFDHSQRKIASVHEDVDRVVANVLTKKLDHAAGKSNRQCADSQ